MSKAAELAALIGSQSSLANRNMIGNGAFNIHQRDATFTQTGSGGGSVIERWREDQSNVGQLSVEVTRATDSPDTFPGSYSLKWQAKTPEDSLAANEMTSLIHRIEGKDCQRLLYGTSSAKNTTLSFWVKSSIAGTFSVRIYQTDGNDNISKPYTINSADTWEYKTINYPGNTAATINDDNTYGLQFSWNISVGSNNVGGSNGDVWAEYADNKSAFGHVTNTHITTDESTFQITGVQFELGDVATPFELLPIAEDLARCQRYYRQQNATAVYTRYAGAGRAYDTQNAEFYDNHPVQMRAIPTLVQTGTASNYAIYHQNAVLACSGVPTISSSYSTPNIAVIYFSVSSGLTVGQAMTAVSNNNTDSYIGYSAEL